MNANIEVIIQAAVLFLKQMENHRGNEHWSACDEAAYNKLKKSLPEESK